MRRTARGLLVSLVTAAVVVPIGGPALAADSPGSYPRPGRTELITTAPDGSQAAYPVAHIYGGYPRAQMDITPDGNYVAFLSEATNLVPGDTNLAWDAFRHDRRTGRTIRVSVASNGDQAIGPRVHVNSVAISADGRYIAFSSNAANLVPGNTPRCGISFCHDFYRHDVRTGRTIRVSISPAGDPGNNASGAGTGGVALSANGRFVAFESYASNLVQSDTNDSQDVFVRDLRLGKTRRASVSSGGAQANGGSTSTSISANGRYVSFGSRASNLVSGDTTDELCECDSTNIFWHDMKTGKTVRVSVASDGSQASFAAFPSCVVGATSPITLPESVRDVIGDGAGYTICGSYGYGLSTRRLSADGRYVAFYSNATNLVPNDTNFNPVTYGSDAFLYDVKTARTERVSVDSYGRQFDDVGSASPSLSADGRYVTFLSLQKGGCSPATDPEGDLVNDLWRQLLACTTGYVADSFVHDRLSGSMDAVARAETGGTAKHGGCQGLGIGQLGSWAGAISSGGRYVAMYSSATNLVKGDSNSQCDHFVRDRGSALGVGGFGGASGSNPPPRQECVTSDICLPPLTASVAVGNVRVPGADIIGARVVHRPHFGDLFVRLDLARMSAVSGAPSGGLLYGLRFTTGGERYEVRVQRVPGADYDHRGGASFGLFQQDRATGLFTKVATLKGGYGTTGPSVVVAVPLKELGAANGGQLSAVRAFTGVGSYLTGATKVLDAVRLAR